MENRFGVKDFILFLLLLGLIGVVLLAMQQFDRQWTDVQKIRARLDDQGQSLRDIQRALALETLIGINPQTLEYEPALATSWKIEDNSAAYQKFVQEQTQAGRKKDEIIADPTAPVAVTATFTLRTDAHFSDGVPLTADD